jgi:hypothetical protein
MPVVASAAMNAVAERPSFRISFRMLMAIALGLAALAFVGGRFVFKRYGGYRPMALMHVPQTMRYRARVELSDAARAPAVASLLQALDPRGTRRARLEQKLDARGQRVAHELAFGTGPAPSDFVLVFGLKLEGQTGLGVARAACEALAEDGLRSEPTDSGCQLADGAVVGGAPDGAVVFASRAELVKGLLDRVDIGDRLGFSGPSVRGVAPDPEELGRESALLAQLIAAKYP